MHCTSQYKYKYTLIPIKLSIGTPIYATTLPCPLLPFSSLPLSIHLRHEPILCLFPFPYSITIQHTALRGIINISLPGPSSPFPYPLPPASKRGNPTNTLTNRHDIIPQLLLPHPPLQQKTQDPHREFRVPSGAGHRSSSTHHACRSPFPAFPTSALRHITHDYHCTTATRLPQPTATPPNPPPQTSPPSPKPQPPSPPPQAPSHTAQPPVAPSPQTSSHTPRPRHRPMSIRPSPSARAAPTSDQRQAPRSARMRGSGGEPQRGGRRGPAAMSLPLVGGRRLVLEVCVLRRR